MLSKLKTYYLVHYRKKLPTVINRINWGPLSLGLKRTSSFPLFSLRSQMMWNKSGSPATEAQVARSPAGVSTAAKCSVEPRPRWSPGGPAAESPSWASQLKSYWELSSLTPLSLGGLLCHHRKPFSNLSATSEFSNASAQCLWVTLWGAVLRSRYTEAGREERRKKIWEDCGEKVE